MRTKAEPLDGRERASGAALLFLTGKAFLQPLHAPILLELSQGTRAIHSPCPVVHLPQPRPQLRVVGTQFPQLVNALEGTAPAGGTAVNLIQSPEIKSSIIANLQRLGFGDPPLYQGIAILRIVLTAVGLISSNADMVHVFPPSMENTAPGMSVTVMELVAVLLARGAEGADRKSVV